MGGTHTELQFAYSYEKNRLATLYLFRMPQDPKMIRSSRFYTSVSHDSSSNKI